MAHFLKSVMPYPARNAFHSIIFEGGGQAYLGLP